jgi:tRNA uridine 5-carbamoylmethylation protein Kti12
MKLVIIFGPPAVGKLTVGRELAKKCGFRILHKQEVFDLLDDFFFFGTNEYRQADEGIRELIITTATNLKHFTGLIMTFVWAFNDRRDRDFVERVLKLAKKKKIEVYFVELQSSESERKARVTSETRKEMKKVATVKGLQALDKDKDFSSDVDYFDDKNYLKLDNTILSAEKCAELITEHFKF